MTRSTNKVVKAGSVEEQKEVVQAEEAKEVKQVANKKSKEIKFATVVFVDGKIVEFNSDLHGENYLQLAKEFAMDENNRAFVKKIEEK